ncbi:MAG: ATP-binding domain-containing protein [Lentisphaeria bacterium]|nr:ATP-binding domain-containing protein [Lentisphaeria bacterium]
MIDVIKGSSTNQVCGDALANFFKNNMQDFDGQLYIGYPIFSSPEGKYPIDAILIIPKKGTIIFNFVDGEILPDDYRDLQDDVCNKLDTKLRGHKQLVSKRTLSISINAITYMPACSQRNLKTEDEYKICSDTNLKEAILNIEDNDENDKHYHFLLSALQSITNLRNNLKKREIHKEDSKAAKLAKLESSIATLDHQQGRAVIEMATGVQRIRGLAGSGKTIVLALKAAYLHAQHPEWKIAVTFHTRSLKDQFKRLITNFMICQTGEEPNWDNLKIMHAWGGAKNENSNGIYRCFCNVHNIEAYDYHSAVVKFGDKEAFAEACKEALAKVIDDKIIQMFNVILIDEAQDLPSEFLRLSYHLLFPPKLLVYAYDELQSLNKQSVPPPEQIFGVDKNGRPLVQLNDPSQDIILKQCYRNSKQVLTTAHALGFGIYRDIDSKTQTGLIQMFDDKKLWTDVGYEIVDGRLEDDAIVTLERTDKTSPSFLSDISSIEDLIIFKNFETKEEQDNWVVEEIKKNLEQDELRHDDIIVINPNPLTTQREVGSIRAMLFNNNINSHLVGIDTSPDVFLKQGEESIAFSGIYRAKGNEAGMVYIINAQDCYESREQLATVRNRLFTAITRSKAWVRVLGIGEKMSKIQEEYNRVLENNFKLRFKYPSAALREKLTIVNRDRSAIEMKIINEGNNSLKNLLEQLENGDINIHDLDIDLLKALSSKFTNE